MADQSIARRCRDRDRGPRAVAPRGRSPLSAPRGRSPLPAWGALGLLAVVLVAGGCVVPPSGDGPPPVRVVGADARALRYGASAVDILTGPQFRDRMPALFGADWGPTAGGPPTALRAPVPEFFARTESLR